MSARQGYRQVLRAVDRHITSVSGNTAWRDHVRDQAQRAAREADPARALGLLRLAQDYAFLIDSVHQHKELLLSYNIATDRERRARVQMENTAARVGLRLPQAFQDDQQQQQPGAGGAAAASPPSSSSKPV